MAKIFFLILTATLISIATADGESSSEYNSTESQDFLDETLTHLPESTPDNLDTASSSTDSNETDSTLNPVPDSSTESLTSPTSWSTSETPELSTHLAESTPNTTPTDDSTTPRLTTQSSTPLPTQETTNTTPHLTEENHEHSTHSPQGTPSTIKYTEASSTTTSGYITTPSLTTQSSTSLPTEDVTNTTPHLTEENHEHSTYSPQSTPSTTKYTEASSTTREYTTTPRLTTQSSTSLPTQDETNTTPHLTEENHEHSTYSPQSTPSTTMYTEASSTTTGGYTTSSSTATTATTATTKSPATTGLPSTGNTTSTPPTKQITRENVLLKKSNLTTLYKQAIRELIAEEKLINQTYEKLFVQNFNLHEGDKAVRTVRGNLWYGWDNKMITAHVIQCAKAKKNVFVESVEQLENCRNTIPGNVGTTKKEILHVYANVINVINDAMYMENICEPEDCDKLYYDTNAKLINEVIPSAMKDIQTLRRRVLNVRSHMQLCYENIELEHRPSETLNKRSITDCALWSIRKNRILCKVSLTNCAFSKWIISILPWNIE